jgi:hypothetical protein
MKPCVDALSLFLNSALFNDAAGVSGRVGLEEGLCVMSGIILAGWKEVWDISVRISGVPIENRADRLPNASLYSYRQINLVRIIIIIIMAMKD